MFTGWLCAHTRETLFQLFFNEKSERQKPLCQPAALCDLQGAVEVWGWTQKHLQPVSHPQIRILNEQCWLL